MQAGSSHRNPSSARICYSKTVSYFRREMTTVYNADSFLKPNCQVVMIIKIRDRIAFKTPMPSPIHAQCVKSRHQRNHWSNLIDRNIIQAARVQTWRSKPHVFVQRSSEPEPRYQRASSKNRRCSTAKFDHSKPRILFSVDRESTNRHLLSSSLTKSWIYFLKAKPYIGQNHFIAGSDLSE